MKLFENYVASMPGPYDFEVTVSVMLNDLAEKINELEKKQDFMIKEIQLTKHHDIR